VDIKHGLTEKERQKSGNAQPMRNLLSELPSSKGHFQEKSTSLTTLFSPYSKRWKGSHSKDLSFWKRFQVSNEIKWKKKKIFISKGNYDVAVITDFFPNQSL